MGGPLRDNVDFRRYWLGQVASDLGTQLSIVAYPLLVLALGGSAAQAGGITTASLVARTACRLPAGVLVDRLDRRRVMIASDLVRAVALGSIPLAALAGSPTYPHLLIVAIVEGVAGSVFWPAAAVSVRRLVPDHQMTAALARSQARARAATLVGPAVGGWLFTLGRMLPFVGDALSYLVSALFIGRIATPLRPEPGVPSPDRRLSAGLRYFAADRELRTVVAFGGVVNLISASAVLAVVVTARGHGYSSATIGLLLACVGAGAFGGAVIAPAVIRRVPAPTVFVSLGASWIVTFAVLWAASTPYVVGPVLAAQYLLTAPAATLIGKKLIVGTPEHMLGRVSTAADLLMSGLPALGPLVTGVLLATAGDSATWVALAGLAAFATLAALPTLRTLDIPVDPAPTRPVAADRTPTDADRTPADADRTPADAEPISDPASEEDRDDVFRRTR